MNNQQAIAWAKFESFRNNLPNGSIDEATVNDFHLLLTDLYGAFGHDLSEFRVPEREMEHEITGVRRSTRRRPGQVSFSDRRFCDRTVFQRHVDGVVRYFENIQPPEYPPEKPKYGF
jgi:hypothetical protein